MAFKDRHVQVMGRLLADGAVRLEAVAGCERWAFFLRAARFHVVINKNVFAYFLPCNLIYPGVSHCYSHGVLICLSSRLRKGFDAFMLNCYNPYASQRAAIGRCFFIRTESRSALSA